MFGSLCSYMFLPHLRSQTSWYIPDYWHGAARTGLKYRIRMIILVVRMMAIGVIILDHHPQKRG